MRKLTKSGSEMVGLVAKRQTVKKIMGLINGYITSLCTSAHYSYVDLIS